MDQHQMVPEQVQGAAGAGGGIAASNRAKPSINW